MIIPASASKLYQYLFDPEFSRIMRTIESAQGEGLENFDLEVDKLDDDTRVDLLEALEDAGYTVGFDSESMTFEVSID